LGKIEGKKGRGSQRNNRKNWLKIKRSGKLNSILYYGELKLAWRKQRGLID